MNAVLLALPVLVGQATDPVPAPEDLRPGWIALVTILLLCGASLFLWFSMRKQLRRIQVPREDEEATTDAAASSDAEQADVASDQRGQRP
jgi:protein-S-isoprenylcysteine O-methyltransferase Ste14